jgi:hypothetical protein
MSVPEWIFISTYSRTIEREGAKIRTKKRPKSSPSIPMHLQQQSWLWRFPQIGTRWRRHEQIRVCLLQLSHCSKDLGSHRVIVIGLGGKLVISTLEGLLEPIMSCSSVFNKFSDKPESQWCFYVYIRFIMLYTCETKSQKLVRHGQKNKRQLDGCGLLVSGKARFRNSSEGIASMITECSVLQSPICKVYYGSFLTCMFGRLMAYIEIHVF